MTARASVVFLLDVDNTLLDNDRVIADLQRHLAQAFGTDDKPPGAERADRYWAIFEARRAEVGYADYLGAPRPRTSRSSTSPTSSDTTSRPCSRAPPDERRAPALRR